MIQHGADRLHHVFVAATADPADYRRIEMLSLWGALGGDILIRTALNNMLMRDGVLRCSSL